MGMIQTAGLQKEYDVIVVGSGAAGGQTAYTLTMDGAKVLMLEAGRNYDPVTETPMFQTPDQAPLRGTSTPDKPFGFYDATVDGGWQVPGEPYTSALGRARRSSFWWWRARMLGGRTNHWGRISLRNGPYDFKPHSRDGLGLRLADRLRGRRAVLRQGRDADRRLRRRTTGWRTRPTRSPGVLAAAAEARAPASCSRRSTRKKLGIPVIPIHRAVLTQQLDHKRIPPKLHPGNARAQRIVAEHMRSRAACFWATPCGRGCSIRRNYQSTTVHLPPALATGNLDIITERDGARGRRSTRTARHRRRLHRQDDRQGASREGARRRARRRAPARPCASCSTRSPRSSRRASPTPAARSASTSWTRVGRRVSGQIPALENLPPHNEDGAGGEHVYAPWWLYKEQHAGKLDFARGYHIEIGSGRRMPGVGTLAGLDDFAAAATARKFKEDARRYYGSFVGFAGRGEMIPNEDSTASSIPTVKDQWGIPVAALPLEVARPRDAPGRAHAEDVRRDHRGDGRQACSAKPSRDGRKAIAPGGNIIHEVGGAIMGADPKKSVVQPVAARPGT